MRLSVYKKGHLSPGVRGRPVFGLLRTVLATAVVLGIAACATRGPKDQKTFPVPCIWPTPVSARTVSSEFGEVRAAGGGRSRYHQGIDIRAPKGCPVYATADGVVCTVDRDRRGYGKYVVIQHPGGYSTLYAHLADFKVKQGKKIRAGEVIGKVGKTGRATGCHLHYEVRQNGRAVNPRPFL